VNPDVDCAQLALVAVHALDHGWPTAARRELAEIVSAAAARSSDWWLGFTESAARHLRGDVRRGLS
jgi:hypothetical protein